MLGAGIPQLPGGEADLFQTVGVEASLPQLLGVEVGLLLGKLEHAWGQNHLWSKIGPIKVPRSVPGSIS